jgi:CDP-diacylglycerol--serine O-phosphatidyltransferase
MFLFPNFFTAASLYLAMFSIVKTAEGDFAAACWLILGSAICDAIDGPVARLTRTASSFGLQFDSLADLVAFGVAPAFLIYSRLKEMDEALLPSYAPRLALGACALYAIFAAIRLARFNTQAGTIERNHFQGLPTPGAAGTVVAGYLFIEWLTALPFFNGMELSRLLHRSLLILLVVLSYLMVSEIPFPKFKNLIGLSRNPIQSFAATMLIACFLIAFQSALPAFLFAAFALYLLGSLISAARQGRLFAWGATSPDAEA